jgi:HD superfamily phosphohydrolase
VEQYKEILTQGAADLDQDEVADILTNYLACQSSNRAANTKEVESFLSKYSDSFEKTYEYYFNLSQVYLKDSCTEMSLKQLREAYEKSKQDDSYKDDQIRFKVQEMHFLSSLLNQFSNISYQTEGDTCWFEFSKTIKNNILVELNISALSEIYDLNTSIFKETIGSLNWKKFGERIKTQLNEN